MDKKTPKTLTRRQQIRAIADMMLQGYRRDEIIDYMREQTRPRRHKAWIEEQIDKEIAEIRHAGQLDRQVAEGTAISRLTDLFRRSMQISDYKTALAVQKEINRLAGISLAEQQPTTTEPAALPAADLGRLMDVIDEEFAFLIPADQTIDYTGLIRLARRRIPAKSKKSLNATNQPG